MKPLLLLFLVFAPVGNCLAKCMPTIWSSELALGGIHYGDTEQSVRGKLGHPVSEEPRDLKLPRITYPGLVIALSEISTVSELTSSSNRYCTPHRICPGMPFERAKEAYCSIKILKSSGDTTTAYFGSELSTRLTFTIEHDVIQTIRAGYNPLEQYYPQRN